MSAFSRCRQVNLWLCFKRSFWAIASRAGDTAVETTVDASRSCLGLATCVGAMARQIVVARVLLTAAVPPALPVSAWRRVLPAPPLPVITRFLGSACGDRHLASDGPDKAREFAGDRGGDNIGRLASAGELAIARAQPYLSLPGN